MLTRLTRPDERTAAPQPSDVWGRAYSRLLVLVDTAVLVLVTLAAVLVRFGPGASRLGRVPYVLVGCLLVLGWLAVLALTRCYETRFLGHGTEEYRRVGNACVRVAACLAFVAFAFDLPLSRGFVAVAIVGGSLSLLAGRAVARQVLQAGRRQGRWVHRVLLVGSHPHVRRLAAQLRAEEGAGYVVVGACVPGARESRLPAGVGDDVPIVGALHDIPETVARLRADTLAVAASPGIHADVLRSLSYALEGTGVDLVVAPALTNVAGTRVTIRPVAGLPLLHVDEPELTGSRRLLKGAFDRSVASVALLLLLPVLLAVAVVVRATSPGPAVFRQERVGRGGTTFRVWKFRSMYKGAEQQLDHLQALNESDGVLFKIKEDPRITPAGAFLRRYSLDELPQLVNVLRGEMSLVGPRPPLASEVERYEGHTRRRLLVKPGITGLWQVSGRSDLSWDETVRLDLQYVENWSLALDIAVLFRTVSTVVRGSGAY